MKYSVQAHTTYCTGIDRFSPSTEFTLSFFLLLSIICIHDSCTLITLVIMYTYWIWTYFILTEYRRTILHNSDRSTEKCEYMKVYTSNKLSLPKDVVFRYVQLLLVELPTTKCHDIDYFKLSCTLLDEFVPTRAEYRFYLCSSIRQFILLFVLNLSAKSYNN